VEVFGSLVTYTEASVLPPGVSPDCQDVQFMLEGVRTRDGLLSILGPLAGGVNINGLKTHITPAENLRTLVFDSNGNLYREYTPGTLQLHTPGMADNSFLASTTLFGREYIAISDQSAGADMPRQYDDSLNLDRVSQVGPGEPPAVADASFTPVNIAAAPTGAVRNSAGTVVTITTTSPHGLVVGATSSQTVTIAGVADTSFNGTFPVASVADATHFTYAQGGTASATSGGGTSTIAGNIAPGVHQLCVLFQTRQGYLTAPSPAVSWTAAGSKQATMTNIPTGPANVVARILAFTGAGGASFYYVPATMILSDNTTTSVTLDFSDTILLSGVNVDMLFPLVELGECAGVIGYASRLFWWGERNKQTNWINLTFDGGWDASGNGRPLGWQRDATYGAGGQREGTDVAWGDAYRVVADGATATRGLIRQGAVQDAEGVARIAANTDYSVRARVKRSAGLATGTLHVQLYSASASISTVGLTVSAATATTTWAEYIAELTPPLTAIPSDLVLRVYADGTPGPSGEFFLVDNIEIFPTTEPVNGSSVRASRAENAESYDGVSGFLNISENDGQRVRAAFVLRDILYFVKDRSLHATSDDGVNEPSLWALSEVSQRLGTPSIQGADLGDDFAVIAGRNGLYLFNGGEPQKLSTEIQPTWDSINWAAGETLWVRVDQQARRILAGVPLGTATKPNAVLVLDYRDGIEPPLRTSLTGRLIATPQSRRWTIWNIAATSCGLIERSDGTVKLFFGSNAGTGKIYQLTPGMYSDDGAAINSYYSTAFLTGTELGNVPPIGRQLFGYLQLNVSGTGSLSVTARPQGNVSPVMLRALGLANPSPHDREITTRIYSERVSYKLATGAANQWFSLGKLVAWLRPAPYSYVRGGV
jgi:hypothetical protein